MSEDYSWREEWQKAFCIPERRHMVDMQGWFAVTVILQRRGRYGRYSIPKGEWFRLNVFYGNADHARSVYFAICNLVDRGDIPGCYVYADACSVEDKAPCLMNAMIDAAYEDE